MKFIHSYLFVVLTSLSFGLFGQTTVTVGTGTSTDYNFPIQPYFNYGWTSQIYTSAEIGTSGVLNSIAFYISNSSGSYTLDNQKIYMRQTIASQHVDKNYPGTTGFTLVYSGSITIGASGWKTITLNTPFTYSNSSNLEILIESRDGSTFTSAVQTRYTSKSEYRTKYDYNDYAFPTTWYAGGRVTKLPNIQFVINTCTAVAGSVSTTTPTICAGNTASLTLNGQTAGQNIQWQESTDNLTFTDIIGASSTTSTTFTTPALTSIKYYRAKVGSGSCIVYSNVQTISVTALPATPTSTNNGPLCAGSTLNLTANTITGSTYAWTGPNSFTSTSQNPSIATITTAGAGTYSVTATVNGCTSVAGITSVTVNNYPTNVSISASATTVTSGTSVTLTASGATNYNWDNGLGTGAVKTVTPTSSTTYTVIADNGNSCKDTTSITIDVTNSSNTGVTTSTVTIGTGTATDYSIPLQSYFNYGWSSQLYLASELQGGGFLNSLSFYVTNSGASYTLDNQKIYVRHTTDASFADKNYPGTTGFTLVYDGPITISSTGWKTIPFSIPFNYNGTSNLEVLVESRDGSTFTSAIQTRYTNQSGTSIYRTKYDYNNDAFPSTYYQGGRIHHYANIQFNKTVCNLATPVIKTNSPVCEGTTLRLSTDTLAGATYSWTGPNGFTSNLQNPVVSSSAAGFNKGEYTLKIIVSNCDATNKLYIEIDSLVIGKLKPSMSVCKNDIIFIYSNGSNAKLKWYSSLDSLNFTLVQDSGFIYNYILKSNTYIKVKYEKQGCLSKFSEVLSFIPKIIPKDSIYSTKKDFCYNEEILITTASKNSGFERKWWIADSNLMFQNIAINTDNIKIKTLDKKYLKTELLNGECSNFSNSIYISPSCTKIVEYDTITNLGKITINLNKNNGPYFYHIGEFPINQLNDYIKLDSTQILDSVTISNFWELNGKMDSQFTFNNLKFGKYIVQVFDKTHKNIYNDVVYLNKLLNNLLETNVIYENGYIYSTGYNKSLFDNIFDKYSRSRIDYQISDFLSVNFLGMKHLNSDNLNDNEKFVGYTFIKGQVNIETDAGLIPLNTPIIPKSIFSIDQYSDRFEYLIDNQVVGFKSYNDIPPLFESIDFETNGWVGRNFTPNDDFSLSNLNYKMSYSSCNSNTGTIQINLSSRNPYYGVFKSIDLKDINGISYNYSNTSSYPNFYFSNLAPGKYECKVNYQRYFGSRLFSFSDSKNIIVDNVLDWKQVTNMKVLNNSIFEINTNLLNHVSLSRNLTKNQNEYYVNFTLSQTNNKPTSYYNWMFSTFKVLFFNETNNKNYGFKFNRGRIISLLDNKSFSFGSSSKFRLRINFSTRQIFFEELLNNSYIQIMKNDLPIDFNNSDRLVFKVESNGNYYYIKDITSNLECFDKSLYSRLKRNITGVNYIPDNGVVRFCFDDEYNRSEIVNIEVRDYSENKYLSNISLIKKNGDNRYELPIGSLPIGKYILEVKNDKNESFYLKFNIN